MLLWSYRWHNIVVKMGERVSRGRTGNGEGKSWIIVSCRVRERWGRKATEGKMYSLALIDYSRSLLPTLRTLLYLPSSQPCGASFLPSFPFHFCTKPSQKFLFELLLPAVIATPRFGTRASRERDAQRFRI